MKTKVVIFTFLFLISQALAQDKSKFEMPSDIKRLRNADLDGNGSFSPLELEIMNTGDAASLFKFSVSDGLISLNDATKILLHLSTSKIARILVDCLSSLTTNNDENFGEVYFKRIVSKDKEKALALLFAVKESPYKITLTGEPNEGFHAYSLLGALTDALHQEFLDAIKRIDEQYYNNIIHQKELTKALFERTKASYTVTLTSPIPSPNIVKSRENSIDDKNAITVFQREYALSCAQCKKPVLQTHGAKPCIINNTL